MKLVSGIVDSGFFAQSALSAEVATKDSLGRNISETYLTAVDIPESAVWNATTQTVSANSAQWTGSIANPQIPVTGINGIKISESGDQVVFEVSGDYYPGNNPSGFITGVDLSDYATTAQVSEKLDTTAFSDVSGTFLTAHQDLSDYQTTAGMTAYQEAGDYYSASNPSGFITGMDLTPYQLTADMTAYQPVGDYMTTADSANFYTTANESGYLTAVPDTYLQNTDLSTEDGKVTAISGIPLSAGGDVPEGVMVESGLEYNAVQEISGYNGSAIAQYGAEKQWLVHDDTLVHAANSAQYALGVNLSAVAQLLGVDETVLWDNANGSQNITLNEAAQNFEFIKVEWCPYTEASNWTAPYDIVTNKLSNDNLHLVGWGISNDHSYQICTNLILSFSSTTVSVNTLGTITISPNAANTSNLNGWKIYKVIGIGRKQ